MCVWPAERQLVRTVVGGICTLGLCANSLQVNERILEPRLLPRALPSSTDGHC